jgi:predicted NUDIX family phosphoesterase
VESVPLTRLLGNAGAAARIVGTPSCDGQAHLFLDEQIQAAAFRQADEAVALGSRCEVRLAGLAADDRQHLGLVYVTRLRQPAVDCRGAGLSDLRFVGNGELQQHRVEFDPWSRILIDHLHAL